MTALGAVGVALLAIVNIMLVLQSRRLHAQVKEALDVVERWKRVSTQWQEVAKEWESASAKWEALYKSDSISSRTIPSPWHVHIEP